MTQAFLPTPDRWPVSNAFTNEAPPLTGAQEVGDDSGGALVVQRRSPIVADKILRAFRLPLSTGRPITTGRIPLQPRGKTKTLRSVILDVQHRTASDNDVIQIFIPVVGDITRRESALQYGVGMTAVPGVVEVVGLVHELALMANAASILSRYDLPTSGYEKRLVYRTVRRGRFEIAVICALAASFV